MDKKLTYKSAGVDIDAGNRFVELIKPHVKSTFRPEVLTDIGGFGGLFGLNARGYKDPVRKIALTDDAVRFETSMTADAPPAKDKPIEYPVAWYRTYKSASGKSGRVFTTTHGASEDLLNEGFRRMVVNACLWSAGLEASIRPNGNVAFVGPYQPTTYNMGGWTKGVKPSDLAGWDSVIGKR